MLHLANRELRVDLIDPAADRERLGPRYCWGGYIWQVHDHKVGALLTGPEWPHATPDPHNGQGLPESFRHSSMSGEPLLWSGAFGLAPGAGALARHSDGTITVTQPGVWQVAQQQDRVLFQTAQSVAHWSYALDRSIELENRQVRSHSRLTNRSDTPLILQWFAHPFFALGKDRLIRVTLPVGTQLSENPGYVLSNRELTLRRAFVGLDDGHLDYLKLPADQPFTATLSHPAITGVRFATNFAPFQGVIWANGNTLSLEPYLALELAPGESRAWTLTYDFGEPV